MEVIQGRVRKVMNEHALLIKCRTKFNTDKEYYNYLSVTKGAFYRWYSYKSLPSPAIIWKLLKLDCETTEELVMKFDEYLAEKTSL